MNEMKNKEALEAVAMAVADEREFEVWWTDSPEMNEFLSQNEIDDSGNVQSLFFAAAYIVWKASRAALAATPANCDSLEQLNGNNDLPAAAPVVLPEPVAYSLGLAKYAHSSNIIAANEFTPDAEHADEWENLYTEQQLRALLATATGLPAQTVEPHPDDVAVDALAALMKAKLAKQRDKGYGGWDTDCTRERLSELLRAHIEKGDPVDVANFCAFLSARGEGIAAHGTSVPVANCYSDDDGDTWRDCPDDCEFVEGRALGEEFELQASIRSWAEVFRVTKVPDETSDDYEVEPVSIRTTAAPQAQADARDAQLLAFAVSEIRRDEMTDSELLDAMEQKRIAVVPEYEGPWDAEIYNDEGKPNHRGSGSTPREAIRAAIAAQAAQQGDDKQ